MSLQADLIESIKKLPPDKQQIVKSLVDELAQRARQPDAPPPRSWFGCLEHLGVSLTEDDVAEARREMWGEFPREVPG